MEPSDAKSIAESLIQSFSKEVPTWAIEDRAFDLGLSFREAANLSDQVESLIENAKITVTFEGESE